MSHRPARSSAITKGQFLAVAFATLLLSAFSVAYKLGEPSLWVDEAYTWFFVSMPWGKMLQSARIDAVNPPFFYLYAKVFTGIFGTSETSLRMPSVIAFLVGLGGSLWVGRQAGGRTGSLAAGWFWAFHPMLVWYARDARPYALAAVLSVLGVGLFLHIRSRTLPSLSSAAGAIAVAALGMLTHYFFMLFAILTGGLSALEISKHRRFFRIWATIILLSVIPLLAWLWWFFQLPSPSFGIGWIARPSLADIPGTVWNLLSGYGGAVDWGSLAFGLVTCVLIAAGWRGHIRWAIVTLLLPILGVWGMSQFRPVYVDRYFIVLVPFLLPIIATGAQRLISGWTELKPGLRSASGLAGTTALLVTTFGAIHAIHTQPAYAKEQWKEVAHWLQQLPSNTPVLLSEQELELPLAYYAPDIQPKGLIQSGGCPSICAWVLRQPYTYPHAFTQSVADPGRSDWKPDLPDGCTPLQTQTWPTGLGTLLMVCSSDG